MRLALAAVFGLAILGFSGVAAAHDLRPGVLSLTEITMSAYEPSLPACGLPVRRPLVLSKLAHDGGLTIAGVADEVGAGRADSQRIVEECVLDLIARDRDSSAVEKADQLAGELEEVAV